MADERAGFSPYELLRAVLRRRLLFALSLPLFVTVILALAHLIPLKYTGKAIFERRKDAAVEETPRDRESFSTVKLTLEQELGGFGAVSRAVEQLGLTRGLARDQSGRLTPAGEMARQQLVNKLMRQTRVDFEVSSEQVDLVAVSFTTADPWLAEQFPNVLVRNYINVVSEESVQRLTDSRDFLQQQVTTCNSRLEELIRQRIDFEVAHAGMLPENPGALQERINRLLADMDTLRAQQAVAEQKLVRLRMSPGGGAEAGPEPNRALVREPNPEYVRLEEKLKQARNDLDDALGKQFMKPTHATAMALQRTIGELEERLKEAPRYLEAPRYPEAPALGEVRGEPSLALMQTQLAIEIAGAQSEAEIYGRELERLENRLKVLEQLQANFGPIRREYLSLQKKITDQEGELKQWEKSLSGVQMALAGEAAKRRTHLNPVQAAQQQFLPSSPSLVIVLALAAAVGLGLSVAFVFVLHVLDRTVMTAEDAIRLFGLPVCGVIGEIASQGSRVKQVVRRWVLGPAVGAVLVAALAVAGLSMTLRLCYPERYARWRGAPWQVLQELAKGQASPGRGSR